VKQKHDQGDCKPSPGIGNTNGLQEAPRQHWVAYFPRDWYNGEHRLRKLLGRGRTAAISSSSSLLYAQGRVKNNKTTHIKYTITQKKKNKHTPSIKNLP